MAIIPLFNRLYIIPIEDPNKRKNSILYVPEEARQKVDHGIVKYRGPGTSKEIKVGDHVLFGAYNGTKLSVSDEGILIVIEEDSIEAIWNRKEAPKLFTEAKLLQWITDVSNKAVVLNIVDASTANIFEEWLKDLVNDDFYTQALEF